MLICISLLTGLRSLQYDLTDTKRLSLQLSTFVTSIASFHYFYMLKSIERVISYRYFDWFFTTPILLIDLMLILFQQIPNIGFMIEIIVYNTIMLGFGYLGEIGKMSMFNSMWIGFIPFIYMFYRIVERKKEFKKELKEENTNQTDTPLFTNTQLGLFITFIALWSGYGINHILPNETKRQLIYNILDLITKGFFGIFIYYSSW